MPDSLTSRLTTDVCVLAADAYVYASFNGLKADATRQDAMDAGAEAMRAVLVAALGPLAKDLAFHAECRPNRQQAEQWKARLDLLEAPPLVNVGDIHGGIDGDGPLESTDLYVESPTSSVLVNVPAGSRVTYFVRSGEFKQRGTIAPAAPLVSPPTKLNVEGLRANCHATFNGGHEGRECEAFHHGMDTVCNVLADWQKRQDASPHVPLVSPPGEPREMKDGTVLTRAGWLSLIDGNIQWLEKQTRTLERDHVIDMMKWAREHRAFYESPPPGERTPPTFDATLRGRIERAVFNYCAHPSDEGGADKCDCDNIMGAIDVALHAPVEAPPSAPPPAETPPTKLSGQALLDAIRRGEVKEIE